MEITVAIVLIIVAWQIGIAIAPRVLHLIDTLRREVDEAAEAAADAEQADEQQSPTKEQTNESR